MRLLMLVALGMLVSRPSEAHACLGPDYSFTLPRDGATGVPTNLRELHVSIRYNDSRLRHLRSSSGEEISISYVEGSTQFSQVVAIGSELQPLTRYELYDEPYPGMIQRVLSFTTGAGPDITPPPQPRFDSLRMDYVDAEVGECGLETLRISGYVMVPAEGELATVVMRFTDSTGNAVERMLPPSEWGTATTGERVWFPEILGTLATQLRLELVEDEAYLVDSWTIDWAGNRSDEIQQLVPIPDRGCASNGPGSLSIGLLSALAFARGRRKRVFGARSAVNCVTGGAR